MSLKEVELKKKIAKKRKLAKKYLEALGRSARVFRLFRNKPTDAQFVDMVVAANYGPGDLLSAGGEEFALEYLLDEFNTNLKLYREGKLKQTLLHEDATDIAIYSSQSEPWGNLFFCFIIDEVLLEYISPLDPNDFQAVEGHSFVVDRETSSIALKVTYNSYVPFNKLLDPEEPPFEFRWQPLFLKPNDSATRYNIYISTPDKLFDDQREKHNVRAHLRCLLTGKVVNVKAHVRSNPIRLSAETLNTSEVDYVVYRVKDADGVVRYYGEGKEDRPEHVNSGVSHNYKINEHFFLRGPMKVEILRRHLSKTQALAIEKFLIKLHAGSELWNVKDYEEIRVRLG